MLVCGQRPASWAQGALEAVRGRLLSTYGIDRAVARPVRFFTGISEPSHCRHFAAAMLSVNRLRERKGGFSAHDWMLDSGAFTCVARDGGYRLPVAEYASQIRRFARVGRLLCAVAQDWMCEPVVLERTGLSVREHQRLTIERFDELVRFDTAGVYVLPVIQGYEPQEYVSHVVAYGKRLALGAWVGVGSVCKRNAEPAAVAEVLRAIKAVRPDLRLHGFGVKTTSLRALAVRELLESADSMAWSLAARKQGRDANDWREALEFTAAIIGESHQLGFFG